MTMIDPSHRLASLLRSQVRASGQRSAGSRQPVTHLPVGGSAPDMASLAAQRIQALAADDPQRKDKALRIFLETVLLQEFGGQLASDASFADMLHAVQEQMRADRHIAEAADELAAILIARR